MSRKAPLSDSVIIAVSRLVDDAQTGTREPSHSDLEFQINRAGLTAADPKTQGQTVGKAKRVRATLHWALENDLQKGEAFVAGLIAALRGFGCFRKTSPNFMGEQEIQDAMACFASEGFTLSTDGELRPNSLANLTGRELTGALRGYVARAQRGFDDAALVIGTGKDLLEATAKHVHIEKLGSEPNGNFPALLGRAFVALDLKTPHHPVTEGEPTHCKLERALYDAGCAVNTLRNKEGTGHGRPWLPNVSTAQSRIALQTMGIVSELLLDALEGKLHSSRVAR